MESKLTTLFRSFVFIRALRINQAQAKKENRLGGGGRNSFRHWGAIARLVFSDYPNLNDNLFYLLLAAKIIGGEEDGADHFSGAVPKHPADFFGNQNSWAKYIAVF